MSGLDDFVYEQSTTTGTGNLTVTRVGGHQRISEAFGTGDNGADNPIILIVNKNASGAEWEICQGYMSDANTLVRGTPIKSSNSNAAVDFSAGTKYVTNNLYSDELAASMDWGLITGSVTISDDYGSIA